jgi:predicted phage tail protein
MVVVNLYGVLESVAQRTTRFSVSSFDEAIRALLANFPKLRAALRDMRVSILVDGKGMTAEDCLRPYAAERIDIMPIVGGTGPAILIVAGAMASYGAGTIAAYIGTTLALQAATIAAISTFIMNMGMALVVAGISQMILKPPKVSDSQQSGENAGSYSFNGAVNTTSQGGIVPVGFGRLRVGSQVISTNIQTYDIPIGGQVVDTIPAAPSEPMPEIWSSPGDSGGD